MDAFKLVLVSLAGWMNRQQQYAIDYLQEEISLLKEQQQNGCRVTPQGVPGAEGAAARRRSLSHCLRDPNQMATKMTTVEDVARV